MDSCFSDFPPHSAADLSTRTREGEKTTPEQKETKQIRCAIYTRKSTNEGLDQEFSSLDAQRESGENYIRSQQSQGWVALPEKYDDGGFTRATIDRPALKSYLRTLKPKRWIALSSIKLIACRVPSLIS